MNSDSGSAQSPCSGVELRGMKQPAQLLLDYSLSISFPEMVFTIPGSQFNFTAIHNPLDFDRDDQGQVYHSTEL